SDVLVVDIDHSLDEVVAATVATIRDAISQG
ncbi:MAG TPA: gluconokinase, partial [Pantoea sp.]|nr:gluconokinase [Pantoea sp.]